MFDPSLIDQFERGADRIRQSIQGLTRADLTAFPVPNTWSIHQIVVHLLDSDQIGVHRMKRIIAEDLPLLIGYNQTRFVQTLDYHNQRLEDVVACFELNRRLFVPVLRQLPPEAFSRAGIHNERGKVTLGELIGGYVEHVEHHLRFIKQKRALLGKPIEE